jgi:hypothetical protein|tara:strand:+ start:6524 stop:6733 length:210 start_codon:yes stop_codon:yes gene_type:complete
MLESFDWDENRMNYCIKKLEEVTSGLDNKSVIIENNDIEAYIRKKLSNSIECNEIDILVQVLKEDCLII